MASFGDGKKGMAKNQSYIIVKCRKKFYDMLWQIMRQFMTFCINGRSGVNKSARERIGRQNFSQKVPSKKGSLGVRFSSRNYRENAHSKSAQILREDTLGATCSAGPFYLLPRRKRRQTVLKYLTLPALQKTCELFFEFGDLTLKNGGDFW